MLLMRLCATQSPPIVKLTRPPSRSNSSERSSSPTEAKKAKNYGKFLKFLEPD